MYSVVLMMSMTAPADVPQGVFFHRGTRATGCAGTAAAPPRETFLATAPVRGFFAHVKDGFAARPRGFAVSAPRVAVGCAGSTFAAPRATGCSGGTMTLAPVTAGPQAVGAGMLLTRIAVHRQLRIALGRTYDLDITTEQRAAAQKALSDPELYDALVTKVHRDLNKKLTATGHVGAIGDGHLLQILIDSLPKILAFIQELMKLLGFALPPAHDWQPMPRGPYAPPRVVVDYRLAC